MQMHFSYTIIKSWAGVINCITYLFFMALIFIYFKFYLSNKVKYNVVPFWYTQCCPYYTSHSFYMQYDVDLILSKESENILK